MLTDPQSTWRRKTTSASEPSNTFIVVPKWSETTLSEGINKNVHNFVWVLLHQFGNLLVTLCRYIAFVYRQWKVSQEITSDYDRTPAAAKAIFTCLSCNDGCLHLRTDVGSNPEWKLSQVEDVYVTKACSQLAAVIHVDFFNNGRDKMAGTLSTPFEDVRHKIYSPSTLNFASVRIPTMSIRHHPSFNVVHRLEGSPSARCVSAAHVICKDIYCYFLQWLIT
jgi:hypothetical protein